MLGAVDCLRTGGDGGVRADAEAAHAGALSPTAGASAAAAAS